MKELVVGRLSAPSKCNYRVLINGRYFDYIEEKAM